jgi:alkylation response protein AidB-like acyl-CoA dehydrogenase
MADVIVDERDVQFVLWEHLGVEDLFKQEEFKDFTREDFNMIISESKKFAEEVVMPANVEGDREGVKLEDGQVKVCQAYKSAYDAFCEAGWIALGSSPEFGGQGLPEILGIAASEYLSAASVGFAMYPGLTRAGGNLINEVCTEDQKKKYLPNMIVGKWGGTMCLTEAGAGSAVGDLKSTAKKKGDKWFITGSKTFISSGDNDLVENNIHLVLARAEGSPPGIKGISLFIVPKYKINDDGSLGEINDVVCTNIEHKMGIHGSSTCTLNFGDKDNCEGELVGELDKGIRYMFLMMNEARIGTGLLGHSSASAAYQCALKFSKERIQGVAIENMKDVNAPRVEIIKHPDVRRMLLSMKAYVEGMRALIYKGVYYSTLAHLASDPAEKEKYEDLLALLTPVIKAYCSDQGFLVTRDAVQMFGGYGYCSEYPVEQYLRDCKISSIYEGTNAIQALDLVGRKVLNIKKQMKPYNDFIAMIKEVADKATKHETLGPFAEKVKAAIESLDNITKHLAGLGMSGDQAYPVLVATPYLKMFGDVCLGWLWIEQLLIADEKLKAIYEQEGAKDDEAKAAVVEKLNEAAFYKGKIHAGKYFIDCLLPEADAVATYIKTNNRDVLEIPEKAF